MDTKELIEERDSLIAAVARIHIDFPELECKAMHAEIRDLTKMIEQRQTPAAA